MPVSVTENARYCDRKCQVQNIAKMKYLNHRICREAEICNLHQMPENPKCQKKNKNDRFQEKRSKNEAEEEPEEP